MTPRKRLGMAIALPFAIVFGGLFIGCGGQVVSNDQDYPRGFDYPVITVALDTMLSRFVRGRGEFRVDVCPQRMVGAWHQISSLVERDPPYTNAKRRNTSASEILANSFNPISMRPRPKSQARGGDLSLKKLAYSHRIVGPIIKRGLH